MPRKSKGKRTNKEAQPQAPTSPPSPLSPRHELFVGHYMIHYNATRAAKDAGFAKASAHSQAHDLLKKPEIQAEIIRRRHAVAAKLDDLSVERIKREIAGVAMTNMQDMAPMFGSGTPAEKLALLTREQASAVQEIVVEEFRDGRSDWREVRRTKFKLNDKVRGLELLAKVTGMITEKHDHQHQHQGLIMHALLQEIDEATRGKPIVDVLPEPVEDGEAA